MEDEEERETGVRHIEKDRGGRGGRGGDRSQGQVTGKKEKVVRNIVRQNTALSRTSRY